MPENKKITVFEDIDRLEITWKWFSPKAYALMVFTVFWCGFLMIWFSAAIGSGAPLFAILFPILHVAAGIYLLYTTLCLFFNKTFVDIADDFLTVYHTPIPWWRGNRKIPIPDIEQIYVHEKKIPVKGGTEYAYELRAKLKDNTDKELLALEGMIPQEALEMEERLERFMGIDDKAVSGEYRAKPEKERPERSRRRTRAFIDPLLSSIYYTEEKERIDLRGEELDAGSITQFDWNDGNSDRSFQLFNRLKQVRQLFLEQNQAVLQAYLERTLHLYETNLDQFQLNTPPNSIVVEGREYFPNHFKTGKCFTTGMAKGLEVRQWHYVTKDRQSFIRIVNFQNTTSFFLGEKLENTDFQGTLDLDDRPERDLEMRENSWDEGDLV